MNRKPRGARRPVARAPKQSMSRRSGSFIRRRLIGPLPLDRVDDAARSFIRSAEALDELLLARGWTFGHNAPPGCLEWKRPAAGADLETFDPRYGHELTTTTTVGYYFDRLEPMDLEVNLAGSCGWSGDLSMSQAQLIADLDQIESRTLPAIGHACRLAGAVMEEIAPELADSQNLIGTGPLPFPVSLIDARCAQIATAHGGDPMMLRRFMEMSATVVRDEAGRHLVQADPFLTDPFGAVTWAETAGHITWEAASRNYVAERATLWSSVTEVFEKRVEDGLVDTVDTK